MKIAVISTYGDMCGIAAYTHYLVQQLRTVGHEVEIFPLNQYFLRNKNKTISRIGDQEIDQIAKRLKEFDAVNLQYEPGTLGINWSDINRRTRIIGDAAPRLVVTFHTIFSNYLTWMDVVRRETTLLNYLKSLKLTARKFYGYLRKLQKRKPVSCVMHTTRDARFMHYVQGMTNVFNHPLAFLDEDEIAHYRAAVDRPAFLQKIGIGDNTAKLLGCFGFLSPYKGYETAIIALRDLPSNYHLLLYGAVHPQSIKQFNPVNEYVETLMQIAQGSEVSDGKVVRKSSEGSHALGLSRIEDLSARVHFMGNKNDEEWTHAMVNCDAVILPYLEVGQTSSGPLSISTELGCHVISARNHAFMEFDKYAPGLATLFDIGNYMELADRIRGLPSQSRDGNSRTQGNIETYNKAFQVG